MNGLHDIDVAAMERQRDALDPDLKPGGDAILYVTDRLLQTKPADRLELITEALATLSEDDLGDLLEDIATRDVRLVGQRVTSVVRDYVEAVAAARQRAAVDVFRAAPRAPR